MGSRYDQRDRLLRALRADPGLLYEVCEHLHLEKVVSPWETSPADMSKRMRRLPTGKGVAFVKRHPTRNINPWEASVSKMVTNGSANASKNFPTQSEALDWCDARLIENGYQLASVP